MPASNLQCEVSDCVLPEEEGVEPDKYTKERLIST